MDNFVLAWCPQEISGSLHIEHVQEALLTQYYKQKFNGKFIMRFDDTNPTTTHEAFHEIIVKDLQILEVKPDKFTFTSDYFPLMLRLCEELLRKGKAYVDNTVQDEAEEESRNNLNTKNRRNNNISKNLRMWNEMKKGTRCGQKYCVRAKMDNSPDGILSDPVIYRCIPKDHPRTGSKYKAYPTYDFAGPIANSMEGVTHMLTNHFESAEDQLIWFVETLELRKLRFLVYVPLNIEGAISKKELARSVNKGLVDGRDDPRYPTLSGIFRKGMMLSTLRKIFVDHEVAGSVASWDKIWELNLQVIASKASRHIGLTKHNLIPVNVVGAIECSKEADNHLNLSEKENCRLLQRVFVEMEVAQQFAYGNNVTFLNWGNMRISEIGKMNGRIVYVNACLNVEDKDFKETLKVVWLPDIEKSWLTPVEAVYFVQNKKVKVDMLADAALGKLKEGEIIELKGKGFFICDAPYKPKSENSGVEIPAVLFAIPGGKMRGNLTGRIPGKQNTNTTDEMNDTSSTPSNFRPQATLPAEVPPAFENLTSTSRFIPFQHKNTSRPFSNQTPQETRNWVFQVCRQIIEDMNTYGVCVVDNLLGEARGSAILKEVQSMYSTPGAFKDGQLVKGAGKSEGPSASQLIRGDKITWVDGEEPHCRNIAVLMKLLDSLVIGAKSLVNSGTLGSYNIETRSKAMVACYPGSGSHYVKHIDNPNDDGRCVTAIYYLNKNWNSRDNGGLLRIFPEGWSHQVADIDPLFDRVIFFWSDRRNPHEVQPAFKTRYAITLWYFDSNAKKENASSSENNR